MGYPLEWPSRGKDCKTHSTICRGFFDPSVCPCTGWAPRLEYWLSWSRRSGPPRPPSPRRPCRPNSATAAYPATLRHVRGATADEVRSEIYLLRSAPLD